MDASPAKLPEYRWRKEGGRVAVVDDAAVHNDTMRYLVNDRIAIILSNLSRGRGCSP